MAQVPIDASLLSRIENLAAEAEVSVENAVGGLVEQALAQRLSCLADPAAFLSGLAHELRTPLASVLMMSELLRDSSAGDLTEKQASYAGRIESAGRDLLRVIEDAHTLARIEARRVPLVEAAVALAELAAVVGEFEEPARVKGLALELRVDDPLDAVVTDRDLFLALVRSLVDNAVRVSERGVVAVSVEGRSEGGASLTVSDTGPPVPVGERDALLRAYQKVSSRSGRKHGGTGLALVLARARALLLGGDLRVEGAGDRTDFVLTLPARPAKVRPGDSSSP